MKGRRALKRECEARTNENGEETGPQFGVTRVRECWDAPLADIGHQSCGNFGKPTIAWGSGPHLFHCLDPMEIIILFFFFFSFFNLVHPCLLRVVLSVHLTLISLFIFYGISLMNH